MSDSATALVVREDSNWMSDYMLTCIQSLLIYADMHPEPHVATPQDGYARHRDEALAGAVSQSYHRFSNTLD